NTLLSGLRSACEQAHQTSQEALLREHQVKFARLCAIAATIAFSSAAPAQKADSPYAPLTKPLTIEQIPGTQIYYSIGIPGVPGKANEGNTSNAGFIITDDGVVVFDALGTPSL